MTMDPEAVLASLGLRNIEWPRLLASASIHALPKDTVLVNNGHSGDFFYIVLEGRVKAFLIDSYGQKKDLSQHGPGSYFGGMGFGDGSLSASVVAVEPSRLLAMPKHELRALLPGNPVFAAQFLENLLKDAEYNAAELYEALQQKTAISEILRAISSAPANLASLLNAVVENAARLCGTTDASIMQVEGGKLRLVAKYGPTPIWSLGSTIPISRRFVTGRAVIDRTPVHVHDLQAAETEFPEGSAAAKQYGHRTVFATPLMREGSAIGAIFVRRFDVQPLTDKQMALLNTFADQTVIAIENVRLFNEIREKSRTVEEQAKELAEWNAELERRVAGQVAQLERLTRLEHELSLARDIQDSMLPRSIPKLAGYEFSARMIPAKSVGGDFFDFIQLGDGLLAIAVGDVSDKGVPAALFMAMVRSLLRAEAHPGRPLQKVLRSVNRHLMDMNDKEMFVTILFGVLDSATHQFQYVRAGHEAPILFDARGSFKRLPKANGQALGLFEPIALDEQTVELSKGSMLLLYSDGISEAPNRLNISFGQEGIVRTIGRVPQVSAQTICNELIRAVVEHQGGLPQHDDMTLVMLRAV